MPCVNQCIEFACCNRIRSTVLLVMYRIYAWRNPSCIIMHREISLYARLVGIINLRARESSCDMWCRLSCLFRRGSCHNDCDRRSQWCVAKHNAIIMIDPDHCKGWTPCKCWTHCKGMTWCRALTRCNQSKNDDTSKATGDSLNFSKKPLRFAVYPSTFYIHLYTL